MYSTLTVIVMLATGNTVAQAGAIDDARVARDLAVASLERLDAITGPTSDPLALAEQLRVEVHMPLLSYHSGLSHYAEYEGSEVLPFVACFMEVTVEVDRFSNEVEYALKVGTTLPEMVNRAEYTAALGRCNIALKTASKP